MPYIRPILTEGHPVLRKVAKKVPISDITTPLMQQLFDDMFATMYDAPGIGLAAPQIGVSQRIFTVDLQDDESEYGPMVLINPVFSNMEGEIEATEGCLSVPNYVGEVTRYERLICSAYDHHGVKVHIKADGWFARCLQHEMDHLNGVLYIDIAKNVRLAETEEELAVAE